LDRAVRELQTGSPTVDARRASGMSDLLESGVESGSSLGLSAIRERRSLHD
jgi:hypothetical protein